MAGDLAIGVGPSLPQAAVARLHDDRALAARLAAAGLVRAASWTWDHRPRALRAVMAPAALAPEAPPAGTSP
ncbi:hypothetical protein L6R50_12080 [Myxococcota bacterium]|nr:hypothetical protein [Myxococcota bacterium]